MRVPSSDHVSVAVHEFGGNGRRLVLSHATGFHAYCYLPLADHVADAFTVSALDHRGHGDTPRPSDADLDWEQYGDDAHAVSRALAPAGGLVGFGHSMGATALLMAAHRDPELFDLIVAFEPIVFPPHLHPAPEDESSMAAIARRRRASFASFEAAMENYRSKPPMDRFDPDVLRLYVAHGFRAAPEGVRLKCDPEHEARTFEQGGRHRTWDVLPEIGTRIVVAAGAADRPGPAVVAPEIAERLPNSTFVLRPEWDHFAPFVDPAALAGLITDATR